MEESLRNSWQQRYPDFPWLEAGSTAQVELLLRRKGWIKDGEEVLSADRAGEGNMNLTLRVKTEERSLILKQARPWVEKYDHIEAPWDRIVAESRFYEAVQKHADLRTSMPALLGTDLESKVLLLEDMSPARDMTEVYRAGSMGSNVLGELGEFLNRLHALTVEARGGSFDNLAMRRLNHAHIFALPLGGQLDLPLEEFEPGLAEAALRAKSDRVFVKSIREAGERYLTSGPCLLHGDFFPGSWLSTRKGTRIIDPEFCFLGDPEFDIGVGVAHLAIAGCPVEEATDFVDAAGGPGRDRRWIAWYAAAEVMRRLIGVAQLPLPETEGRRSRLLDRSRTVVLERDWKVFWA